jgi:hypothetical protein
VDSIFAFLSLLTGGVILLLAWCVAGCGLLRVLGLLRPGGLLAENGYLLVSLAVASGLLLTVGIMFGLGVVGLLSPLAIGSVCGLVLIMAAFMEARDNTLKHSLGLLWNDSKLESAVLMFLLIFTVLMSMRAPGHWDDTMYHLPTARFYLEQQAIAVNEFLRFPLFPQNINLLIALGLMMGGDLMAQLMASLPVLIMAVGLVGTSKLLIGTPILGTLAAITLFLLGPLLGTFGNAYVDNGLAMFAWSATLCMAIALQPQANESVKSWIFLAGMMAGAAAGSKFFGLVFAAVLGSYLLLVRRDLKDVLVFSAGVAVIGGWWYLRSFVISGDPVHPAGGSFFGFYLWDAADLVGQKSEQATHGVAAWNIAGALVRPGVAGWLLALVSLFLPGVPKAVRLFQFVFVLYLGFWLTVTQVDRYLAPIYAVGTFLSFYCVWRIWLHVTSKYACFSWPGVRLNWVYALALVGLCVPVAGKAIRTEKYGGTKWTQVLEGRDGYKLFQEANVLRSSPQDRLMHLGFENAIYFYDGIAVGDHFGPARYRMMLKEDGTVRPAEEILALMKRFGATAFAINKVRFQIFAPDSFQNAFDLVGEDDNGYLFVPKSRPTPVFLPSSSSTLLTPWLPGSMLLAPRCS